MKNQDVLWAVDTSFQTMKGVSDESYPISRGNCFSVITENEIRRRQLHFAKSAWF